jgi:hypothetical protein
MKVVAPNNYHGWRIGEAIAEPSFSCFYVSLSARQVRHRSKSDPQRANVNECAISPSALFVAVDAHEAT